MLVVQQWKETDATPPFHRVPSMASPDQGVVAKVRKGLRVGSPKGTGSEVVMEGRRSRGGVRVSGGHKGRQPGVGGDGESQKGRGQGRGRGPRARKRGGRAWPALILYFPFVFSLVR